MFLPLVDMLRCVRPHDETWLVASIERAEDRDIVEGRLGCPVCRAEYPIRDGVVYFADEHVRPAAAEPSEREAVRLAAALDLTDARMVAVLHGEWGTHAQLVRGVSPSQLLLLNPPEGLTSGDGISIVVAETAPFAPSSVHAVAIDARASEAIRAGLLASLRGDGRMVGRVAMANPPELVELARDADVWVASRPLDSATSRPIMPTRRSAGSPKVD